MTIAEQSSEQDYTLYHLRYSEAVSSPNHWKQRAQALALSVDPETHQILGCFTGLFGLKSSDCFCLISGPNASAATQKDLAPTILAQTSMNATLRPDSPKILSQDGIYVFRFWKIAGDQVDHAVALSAAAWTTFEEGFDTEVKALFRQQVREEEESMLLITWYKNLTAWEASRRPDPRAQDYFRQRQALIHSVLPIATRVIQP
jgi:hypothetical protein